MFCLMKSALSRLAGVSAAEPGTFVHVSQLPAESPMEMYFM